MTNSLPLKILIFASLLISLSSLTWFVAARKEGKITLAGYEKIQPGMTAKEVECILGIPDEEHTRGDAYMFLPAGVRGSRKNVINYGSYRCLSFRLGEVNSIYAEEKVWRREGIEVWLLFDNGIVICKRTFNG